MMFHQNEYFLFLFLFMASFKTYKFHGKVYHINWIKYFDLFSPKRNVKYEFPNVFLA